MNFTFVHIYDAPSFCCSQGGVAHGKNRGFFPVKNGVVVPSKMDAYLIPTECLSVFDKASAHFFFVILHQYFDICLYIVP